MGLKFWPANRRASGHLTRCGLLEQGLQMSRESHDVIGRASPEHEAVPGILEAGLHFRPLQPQKERIYDEFLEVGGYKLLLLLLIPLRSMSFVENLDLRLQFSGQGMDLSRGW